MRPGSSSRERTGAGAVRATGACGDRRRLLIATASWVAHSRAVATATVIDRQPRCAHRATTLSRNSECGDRHRDRARSADRVGPGSARIPRSHTAARADHTAARASPRCGRHRAVACLRTPRGRGRHAAEGLRRVLAVHDRRRHRRRDLRRDAVLDRASRRITARARPPLRPRGGNARCVAPLHLPARNSADARPRHRRRRSSVLGACAWRVRCDHHVRRQLPRHHRDDAVAGVPGIARQPRRGHRLEFGLACRLCRRPGRTARPLAAIVTAATAAGVGALDTHLAVDRDPWQLDVELHVPGGGVLALLGPNGAGKTTVLRVIAGLLQAARGHVTVGGRSWEDTTAGVRLAAEQRSLGIVFQDYLLFPTMSARDNVAFGLRAKGWDKARARAHADTWLARVGLLDHATHRPHDLSGGQAQRVALARALATTPEVLLLDEPLAALDAGTRMSVRSDLRRHLAEFDGATVLVTHDPLDALVLADQVAVMEAGRIVQTGTPQEITRHPRTRYVAQLVGLNLLVGNATGTRV